MTRETRSELIGQLALASGAPMISEHGGSTGHRYDSGTGTLYCDGIMYKKTVLEEARTYFYKMMSQYNSSEVKGARDIAMYYRLALDGIDALTKTGDDRLKII